MLLAIVVGQELCDQHVLRDEPSSLYPRRIIACYPDRGLGNPAPPVVSGVTRLHNPSDAVLGGRLFIIRSLIPAIGIKHHDVLLFGQLWQMYKWLDVMITAMLAWSAEPFPTRRFRRPARGASARHPTMRAVGWSR